MAERDLVAVLARMMIYLTIANHIRQAHADDPLLSSGLHRRVIPICQRDCRFLSNERTGDVPDIAAHTRLHEDILYEAYYSSSQCIQA